MKECKKCGQTKEYSEFHKRKKAKDGLQFWCKACISISNNEMYSFRRENGPTIIRDSKVCQRCNDRKPVSQFAVKRSAADGYTSYCKPCWVIKIRAYQTKSKS